MPHAFSVRHLLFGVILILGDMAGNYYTLSIHQSFIISMDYVPFLVLFNAGMMFFILLVDLINAALRRVRANYQVGAGITDMYRHEH